jgi:hypothetical protein
MMMDGMGSIMAVLQGRRLARPPRPSPMLDGVHEEQHSGRCVVGHHHGGVFPGDHPGGLPLPCDSTGCIMARLQEEEVGTATSPTALRLMGSVREDWWVAGALRVASSDRTEG